MKKRCLYPKHIGYKYYGGRKISFCRRWYKFENFLEDMGEAPPRLTLHRIDNDKGYSPENCMWATMMVQNRNKRGNVMMTLMGRTQVQTAWADELGIGKSTISKRITKYGWTHERALTTPVRGYKTT